MKLRNHFGLAVSLSCLVIAIEAVTLFALGTFYYRHFSTEVDRRLEESLQKPSALITVGALTTDALGQRNTLENIVGPALDDAMMVSADGVILVALNPSRIGHHWNEFADLNESWLRRAAAGGFNDQLTIGNNSYLVRIAPVAATGSEAPLLFDYVRISTTENARELSILRTRLIGGSLAAMLVTTIALLLGIHHLVTRRLRRIAAAVKQVTEGNYNIHVGETHLIDEIGFLQIGIDTMTGQLRKAFTELRNTLRDLENAEQKYRVLVENADECIIVTQDHKFVFANNKTHLILTNGKDSLISQPTAKFIHPDDRAMVQQRHIDRIKGNGLPQRYEFRMVTESGQTIWTEINGVVIDWKGKPATLNFLRDINQRKQHEQERDKLQNQLTQAQKMESIGRLAGGVAHDFNNLLQVILGNASLALAGLPPDNPLHECISEIEKSAKRSAELTRQLLAFARKQAIAPRMLDINEVIEGMLKMLRRLIGENINLIWLPEPKIWPINIDPSQVDQILANLCVNARDVITQAGRISIETRNTTLDNTYVSMHPDCIPGDYVLLTVSDNGHGMDAATLANIFEPFFTTKEPGKGTGLGLATVFGIVKQNKGLINVYSEPGRGTTFKVYFPRGKGSVISGPETPQVTKTGSETVLLVEDEEPILNLARKILSQHGYNVLIAASPEAARELVALHRGPIHLLITDVVMPGTNGRDLRDQLKSNQPGMKCLFMSGYTADIIAHHGVLDNDIEFIQKPFTIQTLTEKIRAVLQKEQD